MPGQAGASLGRILTHVDPMLVVRCYASFSKHPKRSMNRTAVRVIYRSTPSSAKQATPNQDRIGDKFSRDEDSKNDIASVRPGDETNEMTCVDLNNPESRLTMIFISVAGSPQDTIDGRKNLVLVCFIQSDERSVTIAYTDDGF